MSKKRKTRKQKELAQVRHSHQILPSPVDMPTYSVADITIKDAPKTSTYSKSTKNVSETKDYSYLKKDVRAIASASGIILAVDILLFVLLSTGTLRLNFLGY